MKHVKFNYEKNYVDDFINFHKKLYLRDNTENEKEVRLLLTNKHALSKYFRLDKFIIYNNDTVVGRFAITTYPDDTTAYLGFFECTDDKRVAKYLFDVVHQFAKKNNYTNIVGPVDSSFWIKYRLKINMFNKKPYTGEPYNKKYYLRMFLDNNYRVVEHYTSNIYKMVNYDYINEKYSKRYKEFIEKGYKIVSPQLSEFDEIIDKIYDLITNLYSDFPIYKKISKEDFIEIFKNYKKIINLSMFKIAYFNDKIVGFFISVPNYSNCVYNLSINNLLKIMKIKNNPKEYVMLYMGVDRQHTGLGKAIVQSIILELKKSGLTSIGALTRDGKITQNYVEDMIKDRYEYVLLEKNIV